MDFVAAYLQTDVKYDLYIHLPHALQMADGSRGTHSLKLIKCGTIILRGGGEINSTTVRPLTAVSVQYCGKTIYMPNSIQNKKCPFQKGFGSFGT
eukprot:11963936-Ditylum_brightwellii.AAC.1